MAPTITLPRGEITAHPAVIATRPARHPFIIIDKSGFPCFQAVNIAVIVPAHDARAVVRAILEHSQ